MHELSTAERKIKKTILKSSQALSFIKHHQGIRLKQKGVFIKAPTSLSNQIHFVLNIANIN